MSKKSKYPELDPTIGRVTAYFRDLYQTSHADDAAQGNIDRMIDALIAALRKAKKKGGKGCS